MSHHRAMRRLCIVVFPRFQSLDVTGPLEVFHGSREYEVELVAARAGAITSSSGLTITPHRTIGAVRGPIDTLLVAGGTGVHEAAQDERLVAWLRHSAKRSRRVASVCTGAFLLARAGLLDGRRATTHWASCDELARQYPATRVERDPIFVRDG